MKRRFFLMVYSGAQGSMFAIPIILHVHKQIFFYILCQPLLVWHYIFLCYRNISLYRGYLHIISTRVIMRIPNREPQENSRCLPIRLPYYWGSLSEIRTKDDFNITTNISHGIRSIPWKQQVHYETQPFSPSSKF